MKMVLPGCSLLAGQHIEKILTVIDVAGVRMRCACGITLHVMLLMAHVFKRCLRTHHFQVRPVYSTTCCLPSALHLLTHLTPCCPHAAPMLHPLVPLIQHPRARLMPCLRCVCRDITRVLGLLSEYVGIDSKNYPETLGAMVIINAPVWWVGSFSAAWQGLTWHHNPDIPPFLCLLSKNHC